MCKNCVKEPQLDRGDVCLDSGMYMGNYKGCSSCQSMKMISNKKVEADSNEGDDGWDDAEENDETVVFDHICECLHVVARHRHTFRLIKNGKYQEYEMSCLLCGYGRAEVSVIPRDPRQ
ncbi:churchill-like protein [Cladochytrium replicatum]|nr:churchill-like protein [Cladochytrium replicatum]